MHNYHSTRETLATTLALRETVTTLVNQFYGEASAIRRALTKDEANAAAVQVKNAVDAYLLQAEQLIDQLEPHLTGSGLRAHYDVLEQTLHGEIERLTKEARAAL